MCPQGLEGRVKGDCESPDMAAGNRTWVLLSHFFNFLLLLCPPPLKIRSYDVIQTGLKFTI